MSILGTVVRTRPEHAAPVAQRLAGLPGVDLALNPGDGRLVAVIEDAWADGRPVSAAATLAQVAQWPEVMGTSLVYEYSGPDAPAPEGSDAMDYRAWRDSLSPVPRTPT
ncbi:chaperone NapD [Ideonella sp. 4Y11]|uniref:Chaperone NapD n=1 Tax=Ideonella aquatica TaxID=2824119 RepID=A0A941BI47_9BURK|nr:chaperone NapD [Ideonella aquatica]MBQ0961586.1 chaperone NapD [Ideonella aquatica]